MGERPAPGQPDHQPKSNHYVSNSTSMKLQAKSFPLQTLCSTPAWRIASASCPTETAGHNPEDRYQSAGPHQTAAQQHNHAHDGAIRCNPRGSGNPTLSRAPALYQNSPNSAATILSLAHCVSSGSSERFYLPWAGLSSTAGGLLHYRQAEDLQMPTRTC